MEQIWALPSQASPSKQSPYLYPMRIVYSFLLLAALATSCKEPAPQVGAGYQGIVPQAQVSSYIRRIFQDHNGNLWLGTTQDGIYCYNGHTLTCIGVKEGLAGVCVKAIKEDSNGDIWIATEAGISRLAGQQFTNYTVKDGLDDNDTWSIHIDHSGVVWAGTMSGVCRFDGKRFQPFKLPPADVVSTNHRFSPNSVVDICEDGNGNIWFATCGTGIRKFDGHDCTTYTDKDGLADNDAWRLLLDRSGHLWIGTRGGGVSRFDGRSFTSFTEKAGLAGNNIGDILQDSDGNLWFATSGRGISRYDGRSFRTYARNSGLTQNQVQCIFQDNAGKLWVGCSGGLFRLEGDSLINVTKNGPWE